MYVTRKLTRKKVCWYRFQKSTGFGLNTTPRPPASPLPPTHSRVFLFVLRGFGGFLTWMSVIGVSHFFPLVPDGSWCICLRPLESYKYFTEYIDLISSTRSSWFQWGQVSSKLLCYPLAEIMVFLLEVGLKKKKKWSHHVLGMELRTLNTKFFILWFTVSERIQNIKKFDQNSLNVIFFL